MFRDYSGEIGLVGNTLLDFVYLFMIFVPSLSLIFPVRFPSERFCKKRHASAALNILLFFWSVAFCQ